MILFFVIAVPLANGGVGQLPDHPQLAEHSRRDHAGPAARPRPDLRHHQRRHRPLGRLGDEPRLGALGARDPRRLQCRGAALSLRSSSASSPPSPAPALVGFINGVDHRQAEGAGLHRDPRHLVHRARRGAADVREHHRHRPAAGHPRLWQRGADLSHPRRGRRALLPRAAGGDAASCSAAWTASCPIR